jgi:phosphatidylserine/phosphatidylglycerophosphate/cardiolipin synthase-like enzyme
VGRCLRGAHDKVFIVSRAGKPLKVLTGSTTFSTTGMYVNSNHVVIFKDAAITKTYQDLFDTALALKVSGPKFAKDPLAAKEFPFASAKTPQTEISFAPHPDATAQKILNGLTARIGQEGKKTAGSVLFAVMELNKGTGPVFPALKKLHKSQDIFSYGISDTTDGIQLYRPGTKRGVLVTGKPTKTKLPKPFSQVPSLGLGHQVHHKFVVCGFTRPDAVVYCGSSNLAQGGETSNGDNLIAIHDQDIATAFAIEALGLVDHFNFLDAQSSPTTAAKSTTFFLGVTDKWTKPYFDKNDLRMAERELLA